MKSRKVIVVLLLTLLMALVLSACGQPNVSDAKQQFCDSLNKLNTAVEKLQNVDANTSIDEAKQAKEEVSKAWDELSKASKLLKEAQIDASESAYKEVVTEVDKAISGETTLGDSAEAIAAGAAKLDTQLKAINTTICGVK
jgi:predicted Holliday junction resolvase-like endonuclease